MENHSPDIKKSLSYYKDLLQLLIGIISALAGISSLIGQLFESKYSIGIFVIGLFFLTRFLCNKVINSKKKSFDIEVSRYSSNQIKTARIIKIASYFLLALPLLLIIQFFTPKRSACEYNSSKLGIIVTNFTASQNDDFSYKLYDLLQTEIQEVDSIEALRSSKFINTSDSRYIDSIKDNFKDNCLSHGLLVFGKRSEDTKMFDCNLYVGSLTSYHQNTGQFNNKNVIYLQNPDLINFSIENQAKAIADFILGLLYYNSNNYAASIDKFEAVLSKSNNSNDKKIRSYCYLFIGNNQFMKGDASEAVKSYKSGISYDSTNPYLHYNLSLGYLKSADSIHACIEYNVANKISTHFYNRYMQNIYLIGRKDKPAVTSKNIPMPTKNPAVQKTPISVVAQGHKLNVNNIETNFSVVIDNGKFGIISRTKDTIAPCIYDYIEPDVFVCYGKRFFIVKHGEKYGALNEAGKIDIPINHPSVEYVQSIIKMEQEIDTGGVINRF